MTKTQPAFVLAHSVIREIVDCAENIASDAGVGSSETAGVIVSFLAERPSLMPAFMAGTLSPVDVGMLDHHNGALSWHGQDGRVHHPDPTKARFPAPGPEAETTASPAPPVPSPAYGGVRALEWSEPGIATALGLTYDVWLTRDAAQGYREVWLAALMCHERESVGNFTSKEKAQAACQADFERRVLSCLSPVAVEEDDAKAERKGHTLSDDEVDEATIRQRDIAEDAADKLAEAIGELLGVNVGEHSSAHSPWETALEHAGQAVRNRAPSTPSPQIGKAGAGPVGDAVAWRREWQAGGYRVAEDEFTQNAELAEQWRTHPQTLAVIPLRPVEEPGEVEQLTSERDNAIAAAKMLTGSHAKIRAALAETRERLEKVEAAAQPFVGSSITSVADQVDIPDNTRGTIYATMGDIRALRAALTGDAQEGGK